MKVKIFDPPMCCETGVCGSEIDPALPRFAADLEWLRTNGVTVERFNLAQELDKFIEQSQVRQALTAEGNACLPLIVVDGQITSRGTYPDRNALATYAGIGGEGEMRKDPERPMQIRSLSVVQTEACCGSGEDESSCC